MDSPPEVKPASRWLSRGLEALVLRFPEIDPEDPAHERAQDIHFDVVIVGSGYGGAVALHELLGARDENGCAPTVCLLERGREYLPGMFPTRMSEMAGHVRFSSPGAATARGYRSGLFDVRVGPDLNLLVANGLGGGSLINAGVMVEPLTAVFQEPRWPQAIRDEAGTTAWTARFDAVRNLLGASDANLPRDANALPKQPRLHAMRRIDASARPVAMSVSVHDGVPSPGHVKMNKCRGCGDCFTGCNHGSKESLDLGVLALARAQPERVAVHTGATVLRIEKIDAKTPAGPGWTLLLNHTDESLRRRQGAHFRLRARRVILAAGTLGSTEILMRSRTHDPEQSPPESTPGEGREFLLSPQLGKHFSANGDLLAAAWNIEPEVGAVADEDQSTQQRTGGPTITTMIDHRAGPHGGYVVQDIAVPGAMRRLFEVLFSTANTLHGLPTTDWRSHRSDDTDPCAVDQRAVVHTLPLAIIGRDDANGRLKLNRSEALHEGDGALTVQWPSLKHDPRFVKLHEAVAQSMHKAKVGGRLLFNPAWRRLPPAMAELLNDRPGAMISVHPLGGCVMGESCDSGVVDHLGRVYNAAAGAIDPFHDGLLVLDGSIVATSLGINPALTIAALAQRAMKALLEDWGWTTAAPALPPLQQRPRWQATAEPARVPPTRVEVIEQMRGQAQCADGVERQLTLTLAFGPTAVADLMQPRVPRRMPLALGRPGPGEQRRGRLEVRDLCDQQAGALRLNADLDGELTIFQFEPSNFLSRGWRGFWAWLLNRGLRDSWQELFARQPGSAPGSVPQRLWKAVKGFIGLLRMSTRAGAVRRLEYRLRIHAKEDQAEQMRGLLGPPDADGTWPLHGVKRLTYAVASSPWQQLMQMRLTRLGARRWSATRGPVHTLQLPYLAREGVPLLRVVDQADHPLALIDLLSFGAYLLRMLLEVHLWSLRKPDAPPAHDPKEKSKHDVDRYAQALDGLARPDVHEFAVAELPGGATPPGLLFGLLEPRTSAAEPDVSEARIRLTRYRPERVTQATPVLMIHGYSASGTTFAHRAVRPNLTGWLCERGHEVWVLEMRSSAAMPTATYPWAFEDMGLEDIPFAVDKVCDLAGVKQLDVVAHCMGAAMLSMGLLGDRTAGEHLGRGHWALRDAMRGEADRPGRIRRLVLSQVGPLVRMAPANLMRAYLMRFFKAHFSFGEFRFRSDPSSQRDALIDRALATLPYPKNEFLIENPRRPCKRTGWVGARHRMDALYGRVFKLDNMSEEALDHIDDFFGPFNVDTVSQVLHFARSNTITDRRGDNLYVSPARLERYMNFPILALHGRHNGLADVATNALLRRAFGHRKNFEHEVFDGFGHQDCLIGRDCRGVFERIATFFSQP